MRKFLSIALFIALVSNVGAQDIKFGKVSEEEILEKSHPLEKDANAAVLFREQRTYYSVNRHSGFTLVTEVHERIKIYNKDGFSWATKEIGLYKGSGDKEQVTGIKGYTYNLENGKIVETKLRNDGIFEEEESERRELVKLTMPVVTEGSVIEYKYKILSPYVMSIDMVPLQYTIPINRLETMIRIPEFLVFKKHFNPKSAVQLQLVESRKSETYAIDSDSKLDYIENQYDVVADNIPALKEEAYIDYLQNYAAFLEWELQLTKFPNSSVESYSTTWEDVVNGIFKEGGLSKELNRGFFEKDVDEIVSGVVEPAKKAFLIYNFVKSKVKWNGNRGVIAEKGGKSAYKDGLGNVGDINLLLTAMLNYAGVSANPVIMSTKDNGIPLFPTREGFNYVIAQVDLPTGPVLLDASEKTAAFGELPWRARNWQGRVIREDGTSAWIDLMPKNKSVAQRTVSYQFDENFVLKGKSMNVLNGFFAKSFRDDYSGMTEEKYLEVIESGKGNIVISDITKENSEMVGSDIKENYNFELENGVEQISDKIYFKPLLFLASQENPFKADERSYPIFFDYPSSNVKIANIMVPAGYEVEFLPESIIYNLNDGAGTFKFITSQNGNFLRIQAEVDINRIAFTALEYQALKQFFGKMVEKQTEAIVLSKI